MWFIFKTLMMMVGCAVTVLFLCGQVGLGDFKLYYGPVGSVSCTKEK